MTGNHALLPASRGRSTELFVPLVPTRAFISWTFGRGTVVRLQLPLMLRKHLKLWILSIRYGDSGQLFSCTLLSQLVSTLLSLLSGSMYAFDA